MLSKQLYDENELLRKIAHGDERAFNIIFEQNQQLIFSIAMKLTHSRDHAKEVVQDVFMKVWNMRGELDKIENFGGYLNRISRNHSIDMLRKIAKEALRNVELKEEQLALGDNATEQIIDYHETDRMVAQALATLPKQQRMVYQLCHEQGLKYEEAALQMGISPGTVHAHMKAALGNIRKYLKNMDAMLLLLLLMNK